MQTALSTVCAPRLDFALPSDRLMNQCSFQQLLRKISALVPHELIAGTLFR